MDLAGGVHSGGRKLRPYSGTGPACPGTGLPRRATLPAARWGVAVNMSVAQLRFATLPIDVSRILARTGLAPHRLTLEITESLLIRNFDSTATVLDALKTLGVRIALDDFGAGFTAMNYLARDCFDPDQARPLPDRRHCRVTAQADRGRRCDRPEQAAKTGNRGGGYRNRGGCGPAPGHGLRISDRVSSIPALLPPGP